MPVKPLVGWMIPPSGIKFTPPQPTIRSAALLVLSIAVVIGADWPRDPAVPSTVDDTPDHSDTLALRAPPPDIVMVIEAEVGAVPTHSDTFPPDEVCVNMFLHVAPLSEVAMEVLPLIVAMHATNT